ncbi:PAS-domain containing protein [Frigidibacter sp. RF13]|uniref:hybrid sensor histidine kinase/response regulator n=1 Tax=Frigidibacter sp. RF13 TaxID=2997340 RepID=UPI00226F8C7B|nr:PAS-domain containing protein [Frigidibacter sp. RF13]MCY1125994.1 PAS-domain containing protein [Frigidibacter sp. RF13]
MTLSLVNPADPPERQREKLIQIAEVLMRRVEQATDDGGAAYAQFQRAVMLEDQVRERTRELERALDLLNGSNALLAAATREAEAARQNLANAIETVQEGFALFGADERLVLCNSRFGMQLGDIQQALRPGLPFTDYVALVSASADLAREPGVSAAAWAERRLRRHGDRHVIFTVPLTGDRWVQVSEHRTPDGGTVIIQTDVTEIIRLERQERGKLLDEQARIIRATLDHLGQGVGIFDRERRLLGWNRQLADLLSIPVGRLRLGAGFGSLVTALGTEVRFGGGFELDRLLAWVASEEPRPALTFELARGSETVLAVFAEEMPDRGFVMSVTDISTERSALRAISEAKETLEQRVQDRTEDLARALEEAERANAARARFVAAASHDLLQPLSAAKLFMAAAADGTTGDRAASGALEKAQNALGSVEQILEALLDISRLEAGRVAIDPGPVDLGRLLRQLSDEFAPLAARKGLDFRIVPTSAMVESDATYLRRILQNLIGNAIRYTLQGRVLVGVRRGPGTVRVEVRDTGPGIPEAEHASIFREFHRIGGRASASEGMGLGLAIVERAAAILGHPLDLASEVGQGTCFALTLPLTALASAGAHTGAGWAAPAEAPGGQIVCLIENDEGVRRALSLLLEKWGFSVIDVATGEEALALVADMGVVPDHFLADFHLGTGMDGASCLEALSAAYGPVRARLISANRSTEVERRAAQWGLLQKPLRAEELAAFLLG